MTDGLNLTGFNETGEQSGSNNLNLHLSDAPGKAFASSDMSSQGNAGLNGEGSSSALPITGADESDMPGTYK
jgi:hypothetical protein